MPFTDDVPWSAAGLLLAWEEGAAADDLERPLILLHRAGLVPAGDRPERWPIGQRDARLIALYDMTFGKHVRGTAPCRSCGNPIEIEFDLDLIRSTWGDADTRVELITADDRRLQLRLPSTEDLRGCKGFASAEEAATALTLACVTPPSAIQTLAGEALDAIDQAMASRDPQSQVQLQARCPGCDTAAVVPFDIADYLWRQMVRSARRILADVHLLASAYGWSERDIIAMPSARRQQYLEMIWD